jgi:hypothetical protein
VLGGMGGVGVFGDGANAGVSEVLRVWQLLFGILAGPSTPACCALGLPPFHHCRRQWQVYRRALPGLNSSAVGLIVASVFQLTLSAYDSSPFPITTICIGIIAYGATEVLAVPAPLVVSARPVPLLHTTLSLAQECMPHSDACYPATLLAAPLPVGQPTAAPAPCPCRCWAAARWVCWAGAPI